MSTRALPIANTYRCCTVALTATAKPIRKWLPTAAQAYRNVVQVAITSASDFVIKDNALGSNVTVPAGTKVIAALNVLDDVSLAGSTTQNAVIELYLE